MLWAVVAACGCPTGIRQGGSKVAVQVVVKSVESKLVSRYCMKAFSPVSSGQVVVSYGPLVEPLRLFHPTVLLSVLKRAEQKTGNAPVSLSFRAGLSLTAMGRGGWVTGVSCGDDFQKNSTCLF